MTAAAGIFLSAAAAAAAATGTSVFSGHLSGDALRDGSLLGELKKVENKCNYFSRCEHII